MCVYNCITWALYYICIAFYFHQNEQNVELEYNMDIQTWANVSAFLVNTDSTAIR